MKFKTFISIILAMLCLITALMLAACNEQHTHSYTENTIPSTCTEQGYVKYTCSCGDTYNGSEKAPLLSHDFANYVSDNNATCLENGTETAKCEREGCKETHTREIADSALNHSFVSYVSDNNATCLENGTETAKCEREGCEETYTREIADSALNHSFVSYVSDNNATCLGNATETAKCEREGCKETHTREIADSALNHSFVSYVSDNNATCLENGTETAKCEREGCKETHTREIADSALDHDFKNYIYNKDATCQALGTETAKCERENCEATHTQTKVDFYEEHKFDQQVKEEEYFLNEADCTHKLTYYYSCACGAKGDQTFEIGDFFHDYCFEVVDELYLKENANCERGALYYKSCSCGKYGEQTFEYGYPSHTYDQQVQDAKYLNAAAYCQKGATYYSSCVCGEMGYPLFEAGEPNPNVHKYSRSVKYPTKYEDGYVLHRCPCGDSYKDGFVSKTGSTGLKYTTDGCEAGTCMISGYTYNSSDKDGVLFIPPAIDGLTVVGIVDATQTYRNYPVGVFNNNTLITKVILSDTVKYLGSGAFYECDNIREIDFGKGLESIGKAPFYSCYALTHIILPDSVKSLGEDLLVGTYVRSIYVPTSIESITRYVFNSNDCIYTPHSTLPTDWRITNAKVNLGITARGETEDGILWVKRADNTVEIIGSNKNIVNLVIPETIDGSSVTSIAKKAFEAIVYNYVSGGYPTRVDTLVSVSMPDTITEIGDSAFYDCQKLTTVELSCGLVKIDNYAFYGCTLLKNVSLFPDTLEYIGREAFYKCVNLTKIFIPRSVTYIGFSGLNTGEGIYNREYYYYIESETIPDTWDESWYSYKTPDVIFEHGVLREDVP